MSRKIQPDSINPFPEDLSDDGDGGRRPDHERLNEDIRSYIDETIDHMPDESDGWTDEGTPTGHYTRENWLAYRLIAQLSESGLDINHSPAVQVWDVAHREIIAWMKEHGIKTGLRPHEIEFKTNAKLTDAAQQRKDGNDN